MGNILGFRNDDDIKKKKDGFGPSSELDYEPASFKDMMRYATKFDWFLVCLGIMGSCVQGCMPAFNTLNFRGITNTLLKAQSQLDTTKEIDMQWFTHDMTFYIGMYFVQSACAFLSGYCGMACFFTVCENQVNRIRKAFLKRLLSQEMTFFDQNEVGKLTQKMSSGIDRIRDGTSDKLAVVIQSCVSLVSGLTAAFIMSWRMSLIMLIIIPVIICNVIASAYAVKRSLRKEISAYGEAGAVAEEVLNGIRTVLAFNAQEMEIERYSKHLKRGRKSGIMKAFFTGLFAGIFQLILFGSMGIAFWYGTNLAANKYMTPGTVFACFWAACGGANRLGQAIPQISVIMQAKMAAGEILAMIDMKPTLDCSSEEGTSFDEVKGRIEFNNIKFSYPGRREVKILHGVSFSVEQGQSVALVGHSGCGKSTILSLLMRYYNQDEGTITLDGTPLQNLNINWLRNKVGIVSQEPIIFAATIEENIKMGRLDVSEKDMVKACKMSNSHEFIKKLPHGYQTQIGDGGVKLSGGQKQRLAIARALVRNPRILLLDEATSALDTESERIVQAAIDHASSGRTTITIAHRLSTIRRANKIIVFESGRIVESGNHRELMELNGVYKQLVSAQEIEQLDESVESNFARNNSYRRQISSNSRMSLTSKLRSSIAYSEISDIKEKLEELAEENTEPASIRDIWRFAKPEHCLIFVGLIATAIRGCTWPVFSVIYGRLFNSLSKSLDEDHPNLNHENLINAICFISLGIMSGVVTLGSGFFFGSTGERMTFRLRMETFKNLLRQDGEFYDQIRHSTGHLTTRLASDAPNVQSAIDQRLADVLQGVVALICGVSVAFFFNAKMAPIGMAAPMFIVFTQLILNSYLRRRMHKDVQIAEEASRIAAESIEHVKTVQALTRESFFFDAFCSSARRPHRRALTRGLLQALSFAFTSSYTSVNFGIAYSFGMLLIKGYHAKPFEVFQVIEALNMASFSIIAAATYFPEYVRARVSAGLMFKMINDEPHIDSCSNGGARPPINGDISFKKACFSYPNSHGHRVLDLFDIKALSGQTLALVGPSGSGKSTTIQLLERYYDVTDGSVEIDGTDVRQINIRYLRENMTIVGQEPTLFNLTIAENIAYGLDNVTEKQVVEAAKLANIHTFIDKLPNKYNTPAGTRGSQLSGGQKQRIAIARAMIRNPKILLLDEATSALDTESERIVQAALDKARDGRTCITIAHRLSTIQNSDIICVVKDGNIVEFGKHQELLAKRGIYYKLVQKQSG